MENKLLIYKFYNGYVERDASVCNLYDVLRILNICSIGSYDASYTQDTICWVRDYTKGCTIKTQTQVDTLLLNDPKRLRISLPVFPITFFKYLEITMPANVSASTLIIADAIAIVPLSCDVFENSKIESVNVPGPAIRGIDIGNTEISLLVSIVASPSALVIILNAV